ncbi:unnamed protein product [Cuscuta epithymum]|uniref:Uncharacterized protein n=1 Tax=Cuscuta epithymum TaxID=186058 RepID=A0AAV0BV69_9ASTE|nr:unnamed protein product [Cuscuta epithymum]
MLQVAVLSWQPVDRWCPNYQISSIKCTSRQNLGFPPNQWGRSSAREVSWIAPSDPQEIPAVRPLALVDTRLVDWVSSDDHRLAVRTFVVIPGGPWPCSLSLHGRSSG